MYSFPSSTTVPLESGLRVTANSVGRYRRMRVLQEALKEVVEPVQNCELKIFL